MKKVKIIGIILAILLGIGIIGSLGEDTNTAEIETTLKSEIQSTLENLNEEKETSTSASASSKEEQKPQNQVGSGSAKPVKSSEMPEYSGNAYISVNNNIPNFSSSELTTKAYEKYGTLDSLGRCTSAIASCGKEIMPAENEERGSISSIKPSGWNQAKYDGISGGYLWNRCHLIGWQLSAENANKQNLITGTRYMNTEGMLPFENMVADYIKETGNHVAYRVTPIYEGNNLVCSGVQIEAYSIEDNGEGICFNVYCFNVQPNININYSDGSSSSKNSNSNSDSGSNSNSNSNSKPETESSKPSQNNSENNNQGKYVWIPKSGKKYHSSSSCSNMKNPSKVTLSEAKSSGYTACSKCW